MNDTVIRVENLGKSYVLSHQQEGQSYKALRDVMADGVKLLGRQLWRRGGAKDTSKEEFWALRDVSFEVKQGDRVGIIGRNGAGKSTLLKILSRIVEPTTGQIAIKGRVASLLEVGTGFHPELTGRENIFLNGAILGMSKVEIKRKFDEIVAFAEVEKFLDTPVKRYSSGMYVRLAFAVAAHLEPEILIVDEVLAVGDVQFQKKCLGKMEDVGKEGRTVIFVSHNMGTILSLCNKGILLSQGRCIGKGNLEEIISQYTSSGDLSTGEVSDFGSPLNGQKLKILKVRLVDLDGLSCGKFSLKDKIFIEITFDVLIPGIGYNLSFEVRSMQYGSLFTSAFLDKNPVVLRNSKFEKGTYVTTAPLPLHIMRGGDYFIKVSSAIPTIEVLDDFQQELSFTLTDLDSPVIKTGEGRSGAIMPILEWSCSEKVRIPDLEIENFE
jgi:lipopolysaccharide transport system ATP-binding protein